MATENLPRENQFQGMRVGEWFLDHEIGRGKIGVVYLGTMAINQDTTRLAAIKIVPKENLKGGWEEEIRKVVLLEDILQVVQYRGHDAAILDSMPYIWMEWQYVNGQNLRTFLESNAKSITLTFVETLLHELLEVFVAMETIGIFHGDIHEGNIMIEFPDPRRYRNSRIIKVTDFGIGGSRNTLKPKDDYVQLARLIATILEVYIDPATLDDKEDKRFYSFLVNEFLSKRLLETNPTVGSFVRNARELLDTLGQFREELKRELLTRPTLPLKTPFDYLSCEQIGDSFELLQTLYTSNFPGYQELLQRSNTILTGPRGCGKTTIFRNLSLKALLLSKSQSDHSSGNLVGIYYHCGDLFFAFYHLRNKITERNKYLLVHYFGLALLREIVDTLAILESSTPGSIDGDSIKKVEQFLSEWLPEYVTQPSSRKSLRHLMSFIEREKHEFGAALRIGKPQRREALLPIDFIPKFCSAISSSLPWMHDKTICFYIDDLSMPHISEKMQQVLNDVIMYRWSSCLFKVSTESITTFHPYDSSRKLLEETREFDVVDLGAHFIRKIPTGQERGAGKGTDRKSFLVEVINNRLRHAEGIHRNYKDIRTVLGRNPYASYNELARKIRSKSKRGKVYYAGIDTLSDVFSGDIADMLRLVRNLFSLASPNYEAFAQPKLKVPIEHRLQDRALREYGAGFLNRVAAAPYTGPRLRKIAESFGKAAYWVLRNRESKNLSQTPPWQAFRIELLDSFDFDDQNKLREVYVKVLTGKEQSNISPDRFANEVQNIYRDLLRYGVLLRDLRGKSQRGAVVPRLYLRRLLIPTFLLTPNQRDSISLEISDFLTLLWAPSRFLPILKRKGFGTYESQQGRLFK